MKRTTQIPFRGKTIQVFTGPTEGHDVFTIFLRLNASFVMDPCASITVMWPHLTYPGIEGQTCKSVCAWFWGPNRQTYHLRCWRVFGLRQVLTSSSFPQNPTYIIPLNLRIKSIMHVCKNRKNKSSSPFSIDLVNNLLMNEAKTYRSSPCDYIILFA